VPDNEAKRLIQKYGRKAPQHLIDKTVEAIRQNDVTTAEQLERVRQAMEQILDC
jgi:hypothetical protein